jgi:hypothetical protein
MVAKALTATPSSLGKPRVTLCQSGQSDRLSPPITYHLSEPRKNPTRKKDKGAMVVIEHYDLTKLSGREAEQ